MRSVKQLKALFTPIIFLGVQPPWLRDTKSNLLKLYLRLNKLMPWLFLLLKIHPPLSSLDKEDSGECILSSKNTQGINLFNRKYSFNKLDLVSRSQGGCTPKKIMGVKSALSCLTNLIK